MKNLVIALMTLSSFSAFAASVKGPQYPAPCKTKVIRDFEYEGRKKFYGKVELWSFNADGVPTKHSIVTADRDTKKELDDALEELLIQLQKSGVCLPDRT